MGASNWGPCLTHFAHLLEARIFSNIEWIFVRKLAGVTHAPDVQPRHSGELCRISVRQQKSIGRSMKSLRPADFYSRERTSLSQAPKCTIATQRSASSAHQMVKNALLVTSFLCLSLVPQAFCRPVHGPVFVERAVRTDVRYVLGGCLSERRDRISFVARV